MTHPTTDDWESIKRRWDARPPRNRAEMNGTDAQRAEWWQIRCWLKPRLFAAGATGKTWTSNKRRLQRQLREEGFEQTARAAERLLQTYKTRGAS
jgi:hypothetical protein